MNQEGVGNLQAAFGARCTIAPGKYFDGTGRIEARQDRRLVHARGHAAPLRAADSSGLGPPQGTEDPQGSAARLRSVGRGQGSAGRRPAAAGSGDRAPAPYSGTGRKSGGSGKSGYVRVGSGGRRTLK